MIPNLTITISEASDEPGFFYHIYNGSIEDVNDGLDSIDGGLCTTTMENALDMAYAQARTILNRQINPKL